MSGILVTAETLDLAAVVGGPFKRSFPLVVSARADEASGAWAIAETGRSAEPLSGVAGAE